MLNAQLRGHLKIEYFCRRRLIPPAGLVVAGIFLTFTSHESALLIQPAHAACRATHSARMRSYHLSTAFIAAFGFV